MTAGHDAPAADARSAGAAVPSGDLGTADFERRPEEVLSVLEADQLVAAKERAHFGRRQLSRGVRGLLWGLRLYVLAMMILIAIQVVNAVHGGH
jgi:hypothetical protein